MLISLRDTVYSVSVVPFESKIYRLDASYLLRSNTVYQGAGIGKTILRANASGFSLIRGTPVSNVTLKDLTLDGQVDVPTNTQGMGCGLLFNDCIGIRLQNVEILNIDQGGFFAQMSDGLELVNVQAKHCWTGLVFNSCTNGSIHDSLVDGTDGDGIYLTESASDQLYCCRHMRVERNIVRNTGDTAIDVSAKTSPSTKYSDDIHALNNSCEGWNSSTHTRTPSCYGITASRVINSEFNYNIVKNYRNPAGTGNGFWIGYMPSITPLNTFVAHNTIFNSDIPIRSAGALPASYIFDNAIDPS